MIILTQHPVVIDLSQPAMEVIFARCQSGEDVNCSADVSCEIDNFCNLLQNLIERLNPAIENLDLIGA